MHPATEAIQTLTNVLHDPDLYVSEDDQAQIFETIGLLTEFERSTE